MSHQNGQTKTLSLAERKLVQDEIRREYGRFKQKARREPTVAERKQIVAIGFAMARRKNGRIPAAPGIAANPGRPEQWAVPMNTWPFGFPVKAETLKAMHLRI